ncbi:hypothetical protein L6R50_00430 [Myxococcota bacterium]|nr:hypothetical protein [Myxococcota bacterium]
MPRFPGRAAPWTTLALLLAGWACTDLVPRDDDDGDDDDDTTADDDTSDDDTSSGSTTVYEIRRGDVTEGAFVTVRSVVVTSPLYESSSGSARGFFVQEEAGGEHSGIYVYTYADVVDAVPGLGRGAVVTLSGEYSEYPEDDPAGSLSELTVSSADGLVIEKTGVELTPETVATSVLADPATAEPWESVLLQVSGTVSAGADDHGQWAVDGVMVDDLFYRADPDPQVGATVAKAAGPFNFSFGAFKILPRDAADLEVDGSTVVPTVVTVPEIQGGTVAEGTRVRLEGVIATTGLTEPYSECTRRAFWVQDPAGGPRSGISVNVLEEQVGTLAVEPGDVLTVEGTYGEYYELSQVTIDSGAAVTRTGTASVPEPVTVADACSIATGGADAEDYEGVLVRVGPVSVTGTVDEIGFGQFEVQECLLVDSLFFEFSDCGDDDTTPDPPSGQEISTLTGVLHYGFDAFKLEPRSASDFGGWTP